MWQTRHGRLSAGAVVLEVVGSFLGQGLYGRTSSSDSNYILTACFLSFGVIFNTGYRGSLIASLTLPRQPPRPETVDELVRSVERVTYESYGDAHKAFFCNSESPTFKALGELIYVGIKVEDGLRDALRMKRAHIDSQENLQMNIAKHFTLKDGTPQLYMGRKEIIIYLMAWPIPHDTPYKHALDKIITSVVEAGLYDQWMSESVEEIARERRIKKKKNLNIDQYQESETNININNNNKGLTITHVQGPLLLLLLGLTLAGVTFLEENLPLSPAASLLV